MKRAAICLGLFVTIASTGCWRPYYYGNSYAPPAQQQAPVFQPTPAIQPQMVQPQVVQPPFIQQPVVQGAPAIQQGYAPNYCPPACPPTCTPW